MKVTSFQDLIVWQKSHLFVLQIYGLTRRFPVDEKFGIVTQIRRSASSIPANISEGYTKSKKDFGRYLSIARGSLEETKYHLILCRDLHYLTSEKFDDLFRMSDEIGKMIFSLKRCL